MDRLELIFTRTLSACGTTPSITTTYGAVGNGFTNDATAFDAYGTAQSGNSNVTLCLPPGGYLVNSNTNLFLGNPSAIVSQTINGYGAKIYGSQFYNATGLAQILANDPRIQTVSAGSLTVTLVTLGDHTKINVGQWVVVGGLCMQNPSGPPNLFYNEIKKITAIDAGTGVVTLDSVLRYSYKSTWPQYDTSGGDPGGPAALFPLPFPDSFGSTLVINGLSMGITQAQIITNAQSVTYNNVQVNDNFLIPSVCLSWTAQYMNVGLATEIDKLCGTITYTACSGIQLLGQSASNVNLIVESCNFTGTEFGLNGIGAKNCTIVGSIFNTATFGPAGFGLNDTIVFRDNTVNTDINLQLISQLLSAFTFNSNSTLTVAKVSGPQDIAIPSGNLFYWNNSERRNYGRAGKVTDVTAPSSDTVIATDIPFPMPTPTGADRLLLLTAPNITASGNTGCAAALDVNGMVAAPIYSQINRAYSGKTTTWPNAILWGAITTLTINVTRAYTGAQTTCLLHFMAENGEKITEPDGTTSSVWNPVINLKIIGSRVLTSGVPSGLQTDDSIVLFAGSSLGAIWFQQGLVPFVACDMSEDSDAQTPIYTIVGATNLGVA